MIEFAAIIGNPHIENINEVPCNYIEFNRHPCDNMEFNYIPLYSNNDLEMKDSMETGIHYRAASLSPSIYWVIRSLGIFYADSISHAERAGAPQMERVADDEWPDPPRGEDNYDWSLVPNWLHDLLTMEQLHDWGLRGVWAIRGCFTGGNIQRVYAIMDWYRQEIPQRELDDPPDWSANSSGSDSDGVIVELSGEIFEDISRV